MFDVWPEETRPKRSAAKALVYRNASMMAHDVKDNLRVGLACSDCGIARNGLCRVTPKFFPEILEAVTKSAYYKARVKELQPAISFLRQQINGTLSRANDDEPRERKRTTQSSGSPRATTSATQRTTSQADGNVVIPTVTAEIVPSVRRTMRTPKPVLKFDPALEAARPQWKTVRACRHTTQRTQDKIPREKVSREKVPREKVPREKVRRETFQQEKFAPTVLCEMMTAGFLSPGPQHLVLGTHDRTFVASLGRDGMIVDDETGARHFDPSMWILDVRLRLR